MAENKWNIRRPAVPYTDADLNWMDKKSRSSVEMNNRSERPALADTDADIAVYDVIFVGYAGGNQNKSNLKGIPSCVRRVSFFMQIFKERKSIWN